MATKTAPCTVEFFRSASTVTRSTTCVASSAMIQRSCGGGKGSSAVWCGVQHG